MPGFFSSLSDPPRRLSFFGRDLDVDPSRFDAAASDPGETGNESANSGMGRVGFFSDPLMFGTGAFLTPAVADFGRRGREAETPRWTGPREFPNADPRMPFFVLPPNAIFNMPIITQLPGTPYVGKDGLPHLDGWNPYEGRIVSPGRGI